MDTVPGVKVAVDAATTAIDKPYDYRVPAHCLDSIRPGARVLVPFGQGNKLTEGIVLSAVTPCDTPRLKSIFALLDETPILSQSELKMALWLRERYFCTLYDAVRVILPNGVWFSMKRRYTLIPARDAAYEAAGKSKLKILLLDTLYAAGGTAEERQLRIALGGRDFSQAAKELESAGVLSVDTSADRRVKDKTDRVVQLKVTAEDAMAFAQRRRKASPAQAEAASVISQIGSATVRELSYFTGASTASINALEKHGIVTIYDRQVLRVRQIAAPDQPPPITLNVQQKAAFEGLRAMLDEEKAAAALLQGVTGSGKTLVYISLVKETLARGKTAIVLVPEIALTPGLLSVFARHFGNTVAVIHSALSNAERYDQWKRIRNTDEVKVILGTRSAVFSPIRDLGLIVVDEEQESSYKSENMPCYHAIDVAKYRCVTDHALLLLGSATPGFETRYYAETGKYRHFTLTGRFEDRPLPRVIIADMRRELAAGNGGSISSLLRREIEENLSRGEQTILFINRRGNARLKACGRCGSVRFCPNCSVAMTYHSVNNRLMCHYCGHSEVFDDRCGECGGKMKFVGAGTQKVELELQELFPGVGTIRMDADTVGAQGSHEKILKRFETEKIPVLIGTQMVTKGLDFPNVTLVGVLAADQSMFSEDFRAGERAFSLMTQVVGRAGRGETPGRAVIQTYNPTNEVILCAAQQDYESYYQSEMTVRRLQGFPPFRNMIYITTTGEDRQQSFLAAAAFRRRLEQCLQNDYAELDMQILGPAPPVVEKVNNKHRFRVTLILHNTAGARGLIASILREIKQDKRFLHTAIFADVD